VRRSLLLIFGGFFYGLFFCDGLEAVIAIILVVIKMEEIELRGYSSMYAFAKAGSPLEKLSHPKLK
jgi:hypothetical protein